MHRWCAGDRMANGRARVPFRRNGTERNGTETSPFLCLLLYMYIVANFVTQYKFVAAQIRNFLLHVHILCVYYVLFLVLCTLFPFPGCS